MGKLTKDEAAALAKLQAKAEAPDEPGFDIEIWDGDRGAKVPFDLGKKWLRETFGFDIGGEPGDGDGDGDGGQGEPDAQPGQEPGQVRRFGGRRVS